MQAYSTLFLSITLLTLLPHASHLKANSLEQLVPLVIQKANDIIAQNPHFKNRELIREFFIQNPQYKAPHKTESSSLHHNFLTPKKITIIGAGPSGLIAALALARAGHAVTVYEKRSEESFALRWQNVSLNVPSVIQKEFPELDEYLQSQHLIQYEMEIDDPTQIRSYRIALGDLQNALVQCCKQYQVTVHYHQKKQVHDVHEADVMILATGAHTLEHQKYHHLKHAYKFKNFPEYTTHAVAAVYYEPFAHLPEGLTKIRITDEQCSWGFKVTLVGNGVQTQAQRLALLKPSDHKFIQESHNPALVWYLFATTKDNPIHVTFSDPTDIVSFIDFVPALATKGVIMHQEKPLILWGDARTSPHPLTGAALTIPFLSVTALLNFIQKYDKNPSSFKQYNQQTKQLALELFIKTLLVTLF